MSLRLVKSPLAPKITITQESALRVGASDGSGGAGFAFIRNGSCIPAALCPSPIANFRRVFSMLDNVPLVLDQFLKERLLRVGGAWAEFGDAINDVHHQMKS